MPEPMWLGSRLEKLRPCFKHGWVSSSPSIRLHLLMNQPDATNLFLSPALASNASRLNLMRFEDPTSPLWATGTRAMSAKFNSAGCSYRKNAYLWAALPGGGAGPIYVASGGEVLWSVWSSEARVRSGCIQCSIGPRTLKFTNGAVRSSATTM